MTSDDYLSRQEHPPMISRPPGILAHQEANLPAQNYQDTLGQLKEKFPRFPTHLLAQVENIYNLLQKVWQCLQEYQRQAENFLQLMETCSQSLSFQVEKADQDSWGSASPEASWHPGVQPPQPSSLQRQNFKDVMATRSSDWLQQPSGVDSPPVCQIDTQPSEDSEPQFWQDVLTQHLWQIFAGVRNKADQPRQRLMEQVPGLESQDAVPCYFGSEPCMKDALVLRPPGPFHIPPAGSTGSDTAEEPAGRDWFFLKPIMEKIKTLKHGEPVLATEVSSFTRHVFTCSRSGIKVWNLVGQRVEDRFPSGHLPVQTCGAYLRTCLLFPNSTTLLTGGHNLPSVSVWDLMAPSLHIKDELPSAGLTCQALATSLEDSLAFASFTEGTVRIWDLRDQSVVRDLPGTLNGAKSIAAKDQNLWTGGLDACLRCWDLRAMREPLEYQFESQIISLSPSPQENWVLVGTANGQQWLQPTLGGEKHVVGCKDSTILSLKFSPLGQWWVSVGMDNLVSIYSMPMGTMVFQVPETTSIMCCDVSHNNRLIVTGSGDQASVYQLMY